MFRVVDFDSRAVSLLHRNVQVSESQRSASTFIETLRSSGTSVFFGASETTVRNNALRVYNVRAVDPVTTPGGGGARELRWNRTNRQFVLF